MPRSQSTLLIGESEIEFEITLIERLLPGNIRCRETLLVFFSDDSGMIVFVGLPEHDTDFVIGKVLLLSVVLENLHVLVCIARLPTIAVALFDPLTVHIGHAIALIAECLWLFLELFACIDDHDAPTMRRWLFISQQPDISEDASVIEHLIRQHHDGIQPIILQNPTTDFALS